MLIKLPLRDESAFDTTTNVLKLAWSLGDIVRKLREQRGWTQPALGVKAGGMNKSVIVRLEAESHKSERGTIERVAQALDVSPTDLYRYEEHLKLFSELTAIQQTHVIDLERRLADKNRTAGPQSVAQLPADLADEDGESVTRAKARRAR